MMAAGKREGILWSLAAAGLLVGTWGLITYLRDGHLAADYGSYVPWGLWVASYVYLIGLSAGAFLVSTLVYVFRVQRLEPFGPLALLAAICCLVAAMLSIWIDLGHPQRAWRLLFRTSFTSVMGWMVWFYTAYLVLVLVELWLALRPELARRGEAGFRWARRLAAHKGIYREEDLRRDRKRLQVLGAVGIPLVVAFSGGVGALFGVVGARPYWHTGLLPILFLSGSLLSGAAMINALAWVLRPAGGDGRTAYRVVFLGRMILLLLLFYVLLEWAEYSVAWYAAIPSHTASLELVLFGPYWWAFWMIHVGLGVLVPLVLLTVKRNSPTAVAAGCGLIAVTFLAVRVNIVIPGLAVEELQGLARAYVHPRLSFDYFPTVTEWLVQIWIIALAGVLFLLGYRWLPILSRKEASRA